LLFYDSELVFPPPGPATKKKLIKIKSTFKNKIKTTNKYAKE
jgi:hypothetical protein